MGIKPIPSSFFQSITSAHYLFLNTHLPFCSSMSPAMVHSDFSTTAATWGLRANNFSETDEVAEAFEEGNAVTCSDADKVCRAITKNCGADQDMESALQACGVQMKTQIVEQVLDRFRFQEKVAFRFFTWAGYQEGYKHEPHVFTEMIDILSCTRYKSKQFSIICDLLFYMKRNRRDALPIEIFVMVLRNYAEKNLISLRKFAKKKKLRIKSKPEINALNMLLDSLCKCSLVAEAQALYEKLRGRFKPDAQTYTVLFFGWCKIRNPDKAMEIMSVMIERGHTPDSFTCNTVLDAFCKDDQVGEALKLFEFMKTKGCTRSAPTAKTYSIMIVSLAQSERTEEALRLLGEMKNSGCLPDVPTYTEIMEGLCSAGNLKEAYNLLDEMGGTGYPPDIVTYNCFIRVLCNLKKTDEALSLLNRITEAGCLPSVHTYNMLIKMFCDVGKLDMAFEMWHGMEKKGCEQDVISYCTLIKGFFDNGRVQEACSCLLDVIERRMKLPYETFDRFLMELSKVGELRMIQRLSEHMRQFYNHRMARHFSKAQKWRNVKGRRR